MSERIVLRGDPDQPDEIWMQFRLFYEGPLRSSNGDARPGQNDRRADHKHQIRQAFHRQLKHFWSVHPFLKDTRAGWDVLGLPPHEGDWQNAPFMWVNIAKLHEAFGFRFVPLVCEQFRLLCELDILLLRRDRPGGIFQSRDLDNRLKTLFDALRMPQQGGEVVGQSPSADEDPFYVLLQDDSLISNVTLETDELLDPPEQCGHDDSFVRLLVNVKLRPYHVNMFNISFA